MIGLFLQRLIKIQAYFFPREFIPSIENNGHVFINPVTNNTTPITPSQLCVVIPQANIAKPATIRIILSILPTFLVMILAPLISLRRSYR